MERDPLLGLRLDENRRLFRQATGGQTGIVYRDLVVPISGGRPVSALLIFIEGHVSNERLEANVIGPLTSGRTGSSLEPSALTPRSTPVRQLSEGITALYHGKALLQIGGGGRMFALCVAELPARKIEPAESESSVYGPRESFTEQLKINLTQIRRRLPGPGLRIESVKLGTSAQTEAVICYLEGLPTDRVLSQIRQRLGKVSKEAIQDVAELVEALSDRPVTIFPTILTTERPDMVAHYLLAGRVAVLAQNSARALVAPALLMDLFSSPDDFYESRPVVFFLRTLRFLAFNVAIPFPAFYVSVTTYHLQALPTELTLSLLAQREGAPLPPPIEAVIMTVVFEVLREAGVRLPRSIGSTVSIVGGLVIGEAAIRSGLTSPAMVLVVSGTAVATFSLPSIALANAATYYRFGLLALASAFGFFGLMIGYLIALANVAGLTSLGVPFASPLFPLMWDRLATAFGVKPRPPRGIGTTPEPALVRDAEAYEEREE